MKFLPRRMCWLAFPILLLFLAVGCRPNESPVARESEPTPARTVAAPPVAQPAAATHVLPATRVAVRIQAGSAAPFTDAQGNVWLADQGFIGGDVIERPDVVVTNTAEPAIYRSEHYSMESFSWPLTNGNYLTKLHFCETFEGISGPGQRVFSFSVQGHDFKDFDVFAKTGGPLIPYVETVPVEIRDGKLVITFTPNIENPQINGIEIIPQP